MAELTLGLVGRVGVLLFREGSGGAADRDGSVGAVVLVGS